jgi:hypothetical protein
MGTGELRAGSRKRRDVMNDYSRPVLCWLWRPPQGEGTAYRLYAACVRNKLTGTLLPGIHRRCCSTAQSAVLIEGDDDAAAEAADVASACRLGGRLAVA